MRRFRSISSIVILVAVALPIQAQDSGGDSDRLAERREYVIGIEDVLQVVTWGESDLTRTVKVRPDGRITLPLVNDVIVEGLTPSEVRKTISAELGKFIRDPNVTVIVEEIKSFRVFFLGEINTQGPIQFYRPTRLLQGIATAGGLSEFAKKDITLFREEFGVEKRIDIDYKRLWSGDPGQENIFLRPGDTILVK